MYGEAERTLFRDYDSGLITRLELIKSLSLTYDLFFEYQTLYKNENRQLNRKERGRDGDSIEFSVSLSVLRSYRLKREEKLMSEFRKDNNFKKYYSYCSRSTGKGRCFYLTIKDFAALEVMSCYYCGGIPSGYDRVDNSIGYRRDNIVPCCGTCNMMKYTSSVKDFINQIKKIYEHTQGNFNKDGRRKKKVA